jgi:DnaJ-class molecular chaperone
MGSFDLTRRLSGAQTTLSGPPDNPRRRCFPYMRTTWQLRNHYDLLEIPRDASKSELDAAKRFQLKVWHQGPLQDDERAKERVQRIIEAHAVLADARARAKYDATLPPELTEIQVFEDPRQQRPDVWKRMAAWMKDENVGTTFLRKIAFQAGDYLERRREPSEKQRPFMLKAWETAVAEGFDPDAEDEE